MDSLDKSLVKNILSNINDTETYNSARLTCTQWNYLLPTVKRFKNEKLKEEIFFEENTIKSYNKRGELLREFTYDRFGNFIFREYNRKALVKTIKNNFPYSMSMVHNNGYIITSRECDIRKEKYINNQQYILPQCPIS